MFECLCENHLHQRTKCRIKSMDDRIIHFNLKPGQADYFTGHYRPFNFKWNVAKRKKYFVSKFQSLWFACSLCHSSQLAM